MITGARARKIVTKTIGSTFCNKDWIKVDASKMGRKKANLADNAPSEVRRRKDEVGKIQKIINTLAASRGVKFF
jgi:hypothetical protein